MNDSAAKSLKDQMHRRKSERRGRYPEHEPTFKLVSIQELKMVIYGWTQIRFESNYSINPALHGLTGILDLLQY